MTAMLSDEQREFIHTATQIISELGIQRRQQLFYRIYPDGDEGRAILGPRGEFDLFARHKYPKHLEFLRAGKDFRERCFMAANRIGKTVGAGGYEMACHLTGEYPDWWEGRRFARPIRGWAAGKTNETTRDILQTELLGNVRAGPRKSVDGTGIVPGKRLGKIAWKSGVVDMVDTIKVRHVTGGWSTLGLKSYQQGRGSFEGTAQHVILLDEEPPEDVYGECLIRTATTNGIIMLTFTPLEGLSSVVMKFLPQEMRPSEG